MDDQHSSLVRSQELIAAARETIEQSSHARRHAAVVIARARDVLRACHQADDARAEQRLAAASRR
jgi:hypothetical protein